jgi:thiamine transport system permease protein
MESVYRSGIPPPKWLGGFLREGIVKLLRTAAKEGDPEKPVGWARELVPELPLVAFVALLVALPAVVLFGGALAWFGVGGLYALAWGPSVAAEVARRAFESSLVQGALSAVLAFAWGYPCGVFLGRHRFFGREILLSFLLVPFLLPPLVVVIGLEELFGGPSPVVSGLAALAHGLPAIILANVFYNAPIVALFTSGSIASASPHLEEAVATLGGSRWRSFRTVWGRGSLLGAASGALLTFLLSFLGFAAPLLLGGPSNATIEVWIYTLTRTVYATPVAAGLALWTVGLLAGPAVAYLVVARRTRLVGGRGRGAPRLLPVRWRTPITAALAAPLGALLLFVVAMLGAVVLLSFRIGGIGWGLGNWAVLLSVRTSQAVGIPIGQALVNTLFFAGAATALVLALVLGAAFSSTRPRRVVPALDVLSFLPVLLSPVILALALRTFWGSTLGTPPFLWTLIVASQAALALPFVLQSVRASLRALPPNLRWAAQSLGAPPWRAFWEVDLPLLRPALLSATLFAFALGLGEFAATNFLYIPTYTTLVVEAYVLETLRLTGPAAALGALLVLVSGAALFLLIRGGTRVRL